MNTSSNIVIFKNDRTGDLITSLPAINLIIQENQNENIVIYLSEINYKMKFLFEGKNVKVNLIKYKLDLKDRFKILGFFLKSNISKVYILRPKNFFFILPIIFYFKKILFYGFCLNGKNNYKRPNNFLRRFLTKFVINDRATSKKRMSRNELQIYLVNETYNKLITKNYNFEISETLKNILPKNYSLIHYKKQIYDELGWGINGLNKIINELLKHYPNVIVINDINQKQDNLIFKNKYDWYDFDDKKYKINNSKILYLANLDGLEMFNTIKYSKKMIACHGTLTLLGNLFKIPILDIFYCNIKNKNDFYRYKNSFHEWKPSDKNYDFIIPSSDLNRSIKKMQFSLKK